MEAFATWAETASPSVLFVALPYATSLAANVLVSATCEALDRFAPRWFHARYKLVYTGERTRYPFGKILRQSLWAQLFLLLSSLSGAVVFPLLPLATGRPLPSVWAVVLGVAAMHVIDDLYFYWNHRTLHAVPWLWRNVHALHHEIKEPTALATNYIHPLEMVLVSVGTFLAALIVRPHLLTLLIFIFVRTGQDVANHSGWEYPFSCGRGGVWAVRRPCG
eukprot:Unigene7097_Nuclearia_a/m.21748 Unigene7097_Nuclearia_a/g.21748  ORF Unigene7097_Nuclearia_a/g.21748 Unigene7097_Nuclearia_a/m.21748 type:complete len:220 (-) Unigene7097_Nuclearia_a:214-873(-)